MEIETKKIVRKFHRTATYSRYGSAGKEEAVQTGP